MSDLVDEATKAAQWVAPGGLPQVIDLLKRCGRRLRLWTAPKVRTSICLAIESENPEDAGLIKSLSFYMAQYISQQHLGANMEVQVVSDDLDNTISLLKTAHGECERLRCPRLARMPFAFQKLHQQRKARMYLFGRLVRRNSSERTFYELELQGIVERRTTFNEGFHYTRLGKIRTSRKHESSAFSSAQVNATRIPITDDDSGIMKWSLSLVQLVQVFIALGTQIQDNPLTAMELLNHLIDGLVVNSITDESVKKQFLKLLIARSAAATYRAISRGDLDEVRRINAIVAQKCPDDHDALVAMAYAAYFLEPHPPVQALEYARRAADSASISSDGGWHYDLAFLLAQNGYFVESLQEYDRIASASYENEGSTVISVILFFQRELRRHPVSVQTFFMVGFIEWKKLSPHTHSVSIQCKDDTTSHKFDIACCKHAIKMFKRFIDLARSPELASWVTRANVYVQKITKHLENIESFKSKRQKVAKL